MTSETLASVFKRIHHIALAARRGAEDFETVLSSEESLDEPALIDLQMRLKDQVDAVEVGVDGLWEKLGRESASSRDKWRRRIQQLGDEAVSLREALQRNMKRCRERMERTGRAKPCKPLSEDAFIEPYHRETNSLQHSSQIVEQMEEHGRGVLQMLSFQRERLKSAQRRILDVANTLGLSTTVLRIIERRHLQDRFIMLGGVVGVIVILWLLWNRL